jgi:IclR family acetate operon transcriptional repressor
MEDDGARRLDDRTLARSAERVLAIIDMLAERGRPIGATRIAQECSIPRSSIYPLLTALQARRYAAYDAKRRTWEAGPRLQEVGTLAPTIAEVFRILDAFTQRDRGLVPTELAERTSMDLERASRALHALEAEGMVSHSGDGRFTLGLRLAGLAARIGPVDRLRTAARLVLLDLRDRTGETANLLIRDGATVLYLDQVESPLALRHSGWVGRSVPLAGTAVGAALLGHTGAQVAINAVEVGVTAVACWIPGTTDPAGVVSVTGPSARIRGAGLQRARDAVEYAAAAIATDLVDRNDPSATG